MLRVRQGDGGTFKLQAWQDKAAGLAFNLTGASWVGKINAADGTVAEIPDDQFTILNQSTEPSAGGFRGKFTVLFTPEMSELWKLTKDEETPHEFLFTADQGSGQVTTFRAWIIVQRNVPRRSA